MSAKLAWSIIQLSSNREIDNHNKKENFRRTGTEDECKKHHTLFAQTLTHMHPHPRLCYMIQKEWDNGKALGAREDFLLSYNSPLSAASQSFRSQNSSHRLLLLRWCNRRKRREEHVIWSAFDLSVETTWLLVQSSPGKIQFNVGNSFTVLCGMRRQKLLPPSVDSDTFYGWLWFGENKQLATSDPTSYSQWLYKRQASPDLIQWGTLTFPPSMVATFGGFEP